MSLTKLLSCLDIISVTLLLLVCVKTHGVYASAKVRQLGPCFCEIEDKIIDLSPLGNTNNTPRFKDIVNVYPFKYSWNPCHDFDEDMCRGVAGCQMVMFPRQFFSLGSQDSAMFVWSKDAGLQLMYQSDTQSEIRRTLYVTLECTDDGREEVVANGERRSENAVYDMTLYSRHACPRPKNDGSGSKLSVGSILLISMLLFVVVYVAAGVMIQMFIRKSTGVQVIPHVSFWSTLPGLIKDGCIFVVRRGKVDKIYQPLTADRAY